MAGFRLVRQSCRRTSAGDSSTTAVSTDRLIPASYLLATPKMALRDPVADSARTQKSAAEVTVAPRIPGPDICGFLEAMINCAFLSWIAEFLQMEPCFLPSADPNRLSFPCHAPC